MAVSSGLDTKLRKTPRFIHPVWHLYRFHLCVWQTYQGRFSIHVMAHSTPFSKSQTMLEVTRCISRRYRYTMLLQYSKRLQLAELSPAVCSIPRYSPRNQSYAARLMTDALCVSLKLSNTVLILATHTAPWPPDISISRTSLRATPLRRPSENARRDHDRDRDRDHGRARARRVPTRRPADRLRSLCRSCWEWERGSM